MQGVFTTASGNRFEGIYRNDKVQPAHWLEECGGAKKEYFPMR